MSGFVTTSSPPAVGTRRAGLAVGPTAATLAVGTVLGALLTLLLVLVLPLEAGTADVAGRLATAAFVTGMSVLTCVGAVLAARRDHPVMAWLMVGTGLAGVLARLSVGTALAGSEWSWPGVVLMAWVTNWSWVPVQTLAMSLLLRFPGGSLPSRRWMHVERLAWVWGGITLLATAFYPGPFGVEALTVGTNPLGIGALQGVIDPLLGVTFATMPVLLIGCAAAPLVRWRKADGEERQQLKWVAVAAGLLALTAPFALLADSGVVLEGLAYLAVPGAIAVAALRYRLWDLGLVVRRSAVFMVASAILAGLYLGLVAAVDLLVGPRGWMAALVGALVVATIAVPVRSAAQRALDRLLFGNRRDPYAVVRDMGARLESTGTDVLSAVVHELAGSLRLPYVAVELVDGPSVAVAGTPTVEGLRLPLVRAGDVVGHLVAGRRRPTEPLSQLDRRLFEDIAGHAAVAVQTVLLDAELRRSYQRLSTVRESERSRLRRELHDGLGPALGAVTMRAEAARNLLRSAAATSEIDAVLSGIGVETESALREVRRLLEELRPTVLVDRGLVAALDEFASKYVHGIAVELQVPDPLPPLPAVTEVAAYRVASEALRNAARHSGAAACTVRLSATARSLVVEVCDDGAGLGAATHGVGLNAMRERVEEVGGQLSLVDSPAGGLMVQARLPRGAA